MGAVGFATGSLILFRNNPSGILDLVGDVPPQIGSARADGDDPHDHGEKDQGQDQTIFDGGRAALILRNFNQMPHHTIPWH